MVIKTPEFAGNLATSRLNFSRWLFRILMNAARIILILDWREVKRFLHTGCVAHLVPVVLVRPPFISCLHAIWSQSCNVIWIVAQFAGWVHVNRPRVCRQLACWLLPNMLLLGDYLGVLPHNQLIIGCISRAYRGRLLWTSAAAESRVWSWFRFGTGEAGPWSFVTGFGRCL